MSRRVAPCMIGLFSFVWAAAAWAGSAVIDTTLITRSASTHPNQTDIYSISRADCLADDTFTFSLSTNFVSGEVLQAWVGPSGADCHTSVARTGASATCRKIFEDANPRQQGMLVTLRDQDILAAAISGASSSSSPLTLPATSAVCEPTSGMSTNPQGVGIYFLFIASGSVADVTAVTGDNTGTQITYDLVGPSAPAGVTTGVGDTLLKVSWGATSSSDLAGYYIFCTTASFAPAPVVDAGAVCVEAGTTSTVVDAGGDADEGGATTQPSTSCPTGTLPADTCDPSGLLVPGQIPSAAALSPPYLCGTAPDSMAIDASISGLTNDQTYAVGVAAYDQLGNVGPLSNVTCQIPRHVLGFYDEYTAAGGTAGGSSFCAVRSPGAKAALTMVGLIALAAVMWLTRRRSPRSPS